MSWRHSLAVWREVWKPAGAASAPATGGNRLDFVLYLRSLLHEWIARLASPTPPELPKSAPAAASAPQEPGYLAGEICGRDGCEGIIVKGESEYGCSCHMGAPPCSSCTTPREYCPECDWRAKDEEWG